MPVKVYKPTSPGRRGMTAPTDPEPGPSEAQGAAGAIGGGEAPGERDPGTGLQVIRSQASHAHPTVQVRLFRPEGGESQPREAREIGPPRGAVTQRSPRLEGEAEAVRVGVLVGVLPDQIVQ